VNINAGDDFLVFVIKKYSHEHVSDLEWLRSYDRLKRRLKTRI